MPNTGFMYSRNPHALRMSPSSSLQVGLDWRGVGASGPLTSAVPHSAAAWRDTLPAVVAHVARVVADARGGRARRPPPLFAVAHSLGGGTCAGYFRVVQRQGPDATRHL